MGWLPGADGGAGARPRRDPRLAWFAAEDGRDALVPSGLLALAADEVAGPERRCPGASQDELVGLVRAFAAVESWAAGGKLGVIAEMIRRDDAPGKDRGRHGDRGQHGDLPDDWSASLRHELALALACSVQSAQTTLWLAWEKRARLPGIGGLLDDGTLTTGKARAVIETFKYLTDADAAAAEALILGQLAGKTYPQVLRLAEQAALTVDPGLAERRREEAQRRNARVTFFREMSGTAGLSGRDLPPDQALAAMAGVNARAQAYEDSGAFGDAAMDALRAYAYLDLLKGTAAEDRIAAAMAQDEAAGIAEALAWANARAARTAGHGQTRPGEPGAAPGPGTSTGNTGSSGDGTGDGTVLTDGREDGDDDDPGDDAGGSPPPGPGSGGDGSGGRGSGPGPVPAARAFQPRLPDLIVPLPTLLGLAERPGEIQGFGLLDPALARDLAAAAAASPGTQLCVTVTSPEGYAIGHGCARPDRSRRAGQAAARGGESATGLPARLNLTVPATALASLAGSRGAWACNPRTGAGPPDGPDPPGGYGTWTLDLPGGRRFTVRLDLVPVFECDHADETPAYRPSPRLRHLVQVRDGTCTFPTCQRHAGESDFEHTQPYQKGGRTCCCNAAARSRGCHRLKQSPDWTVTQPKPGWHQWRAPSGRVYMQEPKRYPALSREVPGGLSGRGPGRSCGAGRHRRDARRQGRLAARSWMRP